MGSVRSAGRLRGVWPWRGGGGLDLSLASFEEASELLGWVGRRIYARGPWPSISRMRSRVTFGPLHPPRAFASNRHPARNAVRVPCCVALRQRFEHLAQLGSFSRQYWSCRTGSPPTVPMKSLNSVVAVADRRLQRDGLRAILSTARDALTGICIRPRFRRGFAAEVPDELLLHLRISLLIVSIMWTGMRMVRIRSAMERAWSRGIHQWRRSKIVTAAVRRTSRPPHEAPHAAFPDEVCQRWAKRRGWCISAMEMTSRRLASLELLRLGLAL